MKKEIIEIQTSKGLSNMLKEDLDRLVEINNINDNYIKAIKKKVTLSSKDIETLDKVSSTMLKRAVLIGKLQQELLDREEDKKRGEKRNSTLDIKFTI